MIPGAVAAGGGGPMEGANIDININAPAAAAAAAGACILGKYELGRLLGCGAFAKVYHGRNIRSGQSVAIKVISKKKISGSSSLSLALASGIKREVSIMRRLRHPRIVKLLEVLATRSKIYLVMELVKGGELFARVAKGRFSEDLSRRYFHQLISAVGYCHSRGVFHRDLKPENLLLDEFGNLKVSDFGLGALLPAAPPPPPPASINSPDGGSEDCGGGGGGRLLLHTLCGTPAYVAPEILGKKGYEGARVDVWSCGVILFVLNAGYLPFNDPNLMVMYKKIYKGDFRCPKWMSPDLKRFLSRLLDPNPDTRITVHEILRDPWFRRGGGYLREEMIMKSHSSKQEEEMLTTMKLSSSSSSSSDREDGRRNKTVIAPLNAFDIISSFSSGLDLSGLFDESQPQGVVRERFVSAESPENIVRELEGLANSEGATGITVQKKEKRNEHSAGLHVCVEKASPYYSGYSSGGGEVEIGIEIYRLTESLAVVEVRRRAGDARAFNELWRNKISPRLPRLIQQSH